MRILCLSDMHLWDGHCVNAYYEWMTEVLPKECPDVIVITGDVFESNFDANPYETLNKIFRGRKVVFTLGNHEFFERTIPNTINHYTKHYNPEKYDVHCLDVIHELDVDNCHFFGNVLWYDGSMSTVEGQILESFANGAWMDKTIKEFDFRKENQKCVELIKEHMGEDWMINILCTHTCPHAKLNLHMKKTGSDFNAYSGVANLFTEVQPDYSICGHTHLRTIGQHLNGVNCINVGNNHYPPYMYYLLDLAEPVQDKFDVSIL